MRFQSAAVNSLLLSPTTDNGKTRRRKGAQSRIVQAILSRQPDFERITPFRKDTLPTRVDPRESLVEAETQQECDPEYDPDPEEEEEADIGILSCGTNRSCVRDEHSSLGGVCVPSDRLLLDDGPFSAYCEKQDGDYCTIDCSQFNMETGKGVITCTSTVSVCIGTFQGELVCGYYDSYYDNRDSVAYPPFYRVCYDFHPKGTFPYDSFCFGSSQGDNPGQGTCTLRVNRVECTCDVIPCPPGSDYSDGELASCPDMFTTDTCRAGSELIPYYDEIAPVAPGLTAPPLAAPQSAPSSHSRPVAVLFGIAATLFAAWSWCSLMRKPPQPLEESQEPSTA